MIPRLVAVSGPLNGWIIYLDEDTRMGRLSDNSVIVSEKQVSGQHCSITRESGRYKLKDLNSHNGTFVNGYAVTERLLKEGDLIQIGNSQFFFWLQKAEVLLAYEITETPLSQTLTQQKPASSRNLTA